MRVKVLSGSSSAPGGPPISGQWVKIPPLLAFVMHKPPRTRSHPFRAALSVGFVLTAACMIACEFFCRIKRKCIHSNREAIICSASFISHPTRRKGPRVSWMASAHTAAGCICFKKSFKIKLDLFYIFNDATRWGVKGSYVDLFFFTYSKLVSCIKHLLCYSQFPSLWMCGRV